METGILFALAAGLLWGASPVLVKRGLVGSDVSAATIIQQGSTLVTLVAFTAFRIDDLKSGIPWLAVSIFIVAGIVGAYLGRPLMVKSVHTIGASKAQSLINASPLLTVLLAALLLGEPMTLPILIGVSMIISGVFFITRTEEQKARQLRLRMFLVPCLAMLCQGIVPVLKKMATDAGGQPVLGALIIHATGLFLLVAAGNLLKIQLGWRPVPFSSLVCFVASGIFYALGSVFTLVALRYSPAVIVAPIWNIQPLVTFVLARATLKGIEIVTLRDGLAAALVVAGVVVLGWG